MKIVITSGGFDPIHKGHIEYLQKAKQLGDFLVCIVNNDNFLIEKKGKPFMDVFGRVAIVKELKSVDLAFVSIDNDNTVNESIKIIKNTMDYLYPNCEIIFAKGGDRFEGEIPETKTCKELNIKIVDGLGKKIESSSNLIKQITSQKN